MEKEYERYEEVLRVQMDNPIINRCKILESDGMGGKRETIFDINNGKILYETKNI